MASFWDELKDLFKTDSQRQEERQQALNNALEAEKGLAEQLAELDRQYRETLPDEPEYNLDELFPEDLGLEKVDYTPETDEEIAKRAEAGVNYEKSEERKTLEDAFAATQKELEERSEEAKKTLGDSFAELDELYSALRKQTENDALDRGLGRSSIKTSALDNLDSEHTAAKDAGVADYEAEMADIGAKISALRDEQDAAYEQLDLKYAAELEERIAALKEERDETAKKYAEYNNKVAEKEQEYAVQREEDIADFLAEREKERLEREEEQREQEAKYGYTGEKQRNYAQRYELAYEFYSSLSPDIAADALAASPNMRYFLGNYYDKLMTALKGDEGQKRYY